jgi:hypothetical protein
MTSLVPSFGIAHVNYLTLRSATIVSTLKLSKTSSYGAKHQPLALLVALYTLQLFSAKVVRTWRLLLAAKWSTSANIRSPNSEKHVFQARHADLGISRTHYPDRQVHQPYICLW